MAMSEKGDLPAVLVPNCRWSTATIDWSRSKVSQSGHGPGRADVAAGSRLEARITGNQDAAVEIAVIQPGTAPRVAYRYDGGAVGDYQGWAGVRTLQSIDRAAVSASSPWRISMAVDRRRGWAYLARGNAANQCVVARRDPLTREWVDGAVIGVVPSTPAIWYDEDADRLMVLPSPAGRVFSSSDGGVTWDLHSARPMADGGISGTVTEMAAAWQPSGVLLLAYSPSGSPKLVQLASTDGGVTFEAIGGEPADYAAGGMCGCVALQDGGFGVWWRTSADTRYRRISSATQPVEGSIGSVTGVGTATGVPAVFEDYTGELYVYAPGATDLGVRRSTDGGVTWTGIGLADYQGEALAGVLAREVAGEVVVVGYSLAAGVPRVLLAWTLGGWCNLEFAREDDWTEPAGMPFGRLGVPGGRVWGRTAQPTAHGWTASGFGSGSLTGAGVSLVTTSNTRIYRSIDTAARSSMSGSVAVSVVSGGSTTAAIVGAAWVKTNAGASTETEIRACFTTTGVRIRDHIAGAEIGALTIDTTKPLQVMAMVGSTGLWVVWWRRSGAAGWAVLAAGSGLSTRAIGTYDYLDFGGLESGSGSSVWGGATHEYGGVWVGGVQLMFGRPVGRPTPVLEATPLYGGELGWLAVGGHATYGEVAKLNVEHTHGFANVDPHLAPSRTIGWRGVQDPAGKGVPEWVVYDCGAAIVPGSPLLGLIVTDSNAKQILVQTSPDGSTWTTIATAEAPAIGGEAAVIVGDTLTLDSASAAPEWITHGALVGGTVHRVDKSAASVIRASSAGVPKAAAAGRLSVEVSMGVTDGAWTAGTTTAYPASWVMVFARPAGAARYWRLFFTTEGARADGGVHRAGVVALCEAHVLGGAPDWGETLSRSVRTDSARLPSGREWRRLAGPPRRAITIGWPSGVDIGRTRTGEHTVTPSGFGAAVAGEDDLGSTLEGLIATTQDGAVPVALLRRVRSVPVTEWRPEMWVYGHLSADTSHTYLYEDAGEDQSARVESLTVEEAG